MILVSVIHNTWVKMNTLHLVHTLHINVKEVFQIKSTKEILTQESLKTYW